MLCERGYKRYPPWGKLTLPPAIGLTAGLNKTPVSPPVSLQQAQRGLATYHVPRALKDLSQASRVAPACAGLLPGVNTTCAGDTGSAHRTYWVTKHRTPLTEGRLGPPPPPRRRRGTLPQVNLVVGRHALGVEPRPGRRPEPF